MRKLYVALVASMGLLVGNVAGAVTLDFEGFSHGDIVSGTNMSGVTIIADNPRKSFDLGVVFDTTVSPTSDPDLAVGSPAWSGGNLSEGFLGFDPELGNALILQENDTGCETGTGTCSDPDDQFLGGSLTFVFDIPVLSFGFDLIDIEAFESGGTVTLFSGMDETEIAFNTLLAMNLFGNNSANRIEAILADDLGFGSIDRAKITFISSGAVDNINFQPTNVPEPATFAMLALGLGGLAYGQRRERR